MVYETEFYATRRPYNSYLSRPTISTYTASPYYLGRAFYDDNFITSYSYYDSPIRVSPTYTRVGSYISRPSFRFNYDIGYDDVPYHHIKRVIPIPTTRITTSPSRVYRERSSPVRIITPSSRIYRRDVASPVRVITSPGRIVNIRVRPSTLTKEFDRIERKYRTSPVGFTDLEPFRNSAYALTFNDATREIRASTQRLMKEIHEPVHRAPSVPRFLRAASLQPTYSRFDPDLIDKYGNALIENEYHVSKNILRPTRRTRDHIEILSSIKYREPPRRYTAKLGLDPARESRKFNEQKLIEDPAIARAEVQALKAANRGLGKVQEVDEDMEKIKQKRLEERRQREEQALMEEQVKKQEQAKKEEADRQAEIQRQERLAAQAAAERQAELERKAAEEAQLAEEARLADEARQAEERRAADEAEAARAAEAARIAEAEAQKAAEEAARLAEEEAAKKAEEERLAEEARLAEEEAARKAEEDRLAELEKIKIEEARLAELEAQAKEEEDSELARQANELAELARSQTQELEQIGEENAAPEETPAEETPAVEEEAAEEPIVEAPASPVEEEAPVVEEPASEDTPVIVEEPAEEEAAEEEE